MRYDSLQAFRRRPRATRWRAAAALLAATLLLCATAAGSERRVKFARGRTKAVVSGRLTGARDSAVFVARARRGQRMRVTVVRSAGPVRCAVVSPSGDEEGQPGPGTIFDGELTQTGPYRIRVNESPMGEPWRGSFLLSIEIR
jgi:hypothetical protein